MRLQAAMAVVLLLAVSVFGPTGIRVCLCTGQSSFASEVEKQCGVNCCPQAGERTGEDGQQFPCEDGPCWVGVTLETGVPLAWPKNSPAAEVICPVVHVALNCSAPQEPVKFGFPAHRPPDRQAIPLTVLFSSFLI